MLCFVVVLLLIWFYKYLNLISFRNLERYVSCPSIWINFNFCVLPFHRHVYIWFATKISLHAVSLRWTLVSSTDYPLSAVRDYESSMQVHSISSRDSSVSSIWLRTGRSRFNPWHGKEIFLLASVSSETHPASCTKSTGGTFPGLKRSRGVTLTCHLI
jgi:hypothetical protein